MQHDDSVISDLRNLDDVVHILGIEDSHITPAEAVKMLQDQIISLQTALTNLLRITPEERQDPTIWFARVDAARAALKVSEVAMWRRMALKLAREVKASFELFEPIARREIGNTNYKIIIDAADEILAEETSRGKFHDPEAAA